MLPLHADACPAQQFVFAFFTLCMTSWIVQVTRIFGSLLCICFHPTAAIYISGPNTHLRTLISNSLPPNSFSFCHRLLLVKNSIITRHLLTFRKMKAYFCKGTVTPRLNPKRNQHPLPALLFCFSFIFLQLFRCRFLLPFITVLISSLVS